LCAKKVYVALITLIVAASPAARQRKRAMSPVADVFAWRRAEALAPPPDASIRMPLFRFAGARCRFSARPLFFRFSPIFERGDAEEALA
jgi:hypothetical protein